VKRVRTPVDDIVARLGKVLSRRVGDSPFLEDSRQEVGGLPETMEDLVRGLAIDIEESYLPAQMEKAKGHGTGDQSVVDLIIVLESFVQGFGRFYPALSAFMVSAHFEEIALRLKRDGKPQELWTAKMNTLASQLKSVSKRWLEISNQRNVRGKTAETRWLFEVSKVLAEANWVCVEVLAAIIEAAVKG
jgi:hypothetical protein